MPNIINGSEIAKTKITLTIGWIVTIIAYLWWCIHWSLSINETLPLLGGSIWVNRFMVTPGLFHLVLCSSDNMEDHTDYCHSATTWFICAISDIRGSFHLFFVLSKLSRFLDVLNLCCSMHRGQSSTMHISLWDTVKLQIRPIDWILGNSG